jgi:hypothetical protein
MLSLPELQAAVSAALLGGADDLPALEVDGDGLDPRARLEIYRHHVRSTLTDALKAAYPVVCRLVDERFFAFAADTFIRACPPSGPCLFEYGADLADFLAAFPPCAGLGYLPDVARLEWAMHAAWHAGDAAPLDLARLAAVAPEDTARLRLRLDPSLTLLASPWPIDEIWRANRGEGPASGVELASRGGVRLEVRRVGDDVVLRALDAGAFALAAGLAAGATLAEAAARALERDPRFDLTGALRDLLDAELVIDLTLTTEETLT